MRSPSGDGTVCHHSASALSLPSFRARVWYHPKSRWNDVCVFAMFGTSQKVPETISLPFSMTTGQRGRHAQRRAFGVEPLTSATHMPLPSYSPLRPTTTSSSTTSTTRNLAPCDVHDASTRRMYRGRVRLRSTSVLWVWAETPCERILTTFNAQHLNTVPWIRSKEVHVLTATCIQSHVWPTTQLSTNPCAAHLVLSVHT